MYDVTCQTLLKEILGCIYDIRYITKILGIYVEVSSFASYNTEVAVIQSDHISHPLPRRYYYRLYYLQRKSICHDGFDKLQSGF